MSSDRKSPFSLSNVRPIVVSLMIGLAGAFTLAGAGSADARLGGGFSSGSRGGRTFSMPPSTSTAPSISPIQRSTTPSGGSSFGNSAFGGSGMLGGGLGRGLLGGFLGAGLFGLLFGNGFAGGLGGGMSLIGLLLQIGLLYLAFRFVMGFLRGRQPAFGGGPASYARSGSTGGSGSGSQAPRGTPITIAPEDYQAFERRLVESQAAYSTGDVGALRRLATPEMAGNFEQELASNARQGVVNTIGDVRLLNGDLSEAWREGGTDYATVAMHFSLVDATVDQRSGQVVGGSSTVPQEVTEVWTFARASGAGPNGWALAAIQQTQ